MEIKVLPLGDIQANCYLISTDNSAVVIDPGFKSQIVTEFLKENSNKECLILLTHAHFDHIGGALDLRENTGVKIGIGALENPALSDSQVNLSDMFQTHLSPFSADILFNDNDEFSVGDIVFRVIHTPGHTVGGVCYLTDGILFSGDTLFHGSIGRTDFPNGDFAVLESSIKKLYCLSGDTVVLSGHGDKTTIEQEKNYNPFIRG